MNTEELTVRKRDGRLVEYDVTKIEQAVEAAMDDVGVDDGADVVSMVEDKIVELGKKTIDIEEIQDIVEDSLMDLGYHNVARSYIQYREKRKNIRQLKKDMGYKDNGMKLDVNAAKLMNERYLLKDENDKPIETPTEMFRRVARYMAEADLKYDKDADVDTIEELFYRAMVQKKFIPNSPALFSAGTDSGTLSACFAISVKDDLEDIFESVKETAMITKAGGGVGMAFSELRPKGDIVGSTGGVSSGPVSFMEVFDKTIDVCKQGGKRRGALMGCLRVDHPDIIDFINAKRDKESFRNFNISVLITDEFMDAYYNDEEYDLINPRNGEVVDSVSAKTVMDQIVLSAHDCGDPGMVFIDKINDKHPLDEEYEVKTVNVCGEQDLLAYETCNLLALNLSKFVTDDGEIDYSDLKTHVHLGVHFLDNMIDMNEYPLDEIEEMTKKTRKIGLGVMGWAEMLFQLEVPYDSEEALELAHEVMGFIDEEGHKASRDLAKVRGNFPLFDHYRRRYKHMRNSSITTVAPTGSRSVLFGTSSGIEPLFAIAQTRVLNEGIKLNDVNEYFVDKMKEEGLWSDEMKKKVLKEGSIGHIEEIPQHIRDIFKTAHEIDPEWHVKMQAAFQDNVTSAVSKTVNLPTCSTFKDVEDIFVQAYETGCKGVTIFRDGCLSEQVLYSGCELCD